MTNQPPAGLIRLPAHSPLRRAWQRYEVAQNEHETFDEKRRRYQATLMGIRMRFEAVDLDSLDSLDRIEAARDDAEALRIKHALSRAKDTLQELHDLAKRAGADFNQLWTEYEQLRQKDQQQPAPSLPGSLAYVSGEPQRDAQRLAALEGRFDGEQARRQAIAAAEAEEAAERQAARIIGMLG
jgi:hypothetical protein